MAESNVTALPQAQTERAADVPVKGDLQPLLDYLTTDKGHEVASRLISVVEGIKQATLDKSTVNVRVEKYIQAGVILSVVIATSLLVYNSKFEASVGVLFGTLVGYVFGKK